MSLQRHYAPEQQKCGRPSQHTTIGSLSILIILRLVLLLGVEDCYSSSLWTPLLPPFTWLAPFEFDTNFIRVGPFDVGCGVPVAVDGAADVFLVAEPPSSSSASSGCSLSSFSYCWLKKA